MARKANEPDTTTFVGRIAAQIRKRRLRQKLSVEDAAGSAGVPVQTWYHWEQGKTLPLERLPAIAAAVGCKVAALLPAER